MDYPESSRRAIHFQHVPVYARGSPFAVPKFVALNSYSPFPFKPAFLPLLQNKKPMAPISARPAMIAPTAIPAFAPIESPPLPPLEAADGKAASPGFAGNTLELGVGTLKSSLVTLKHGT
jgi:hypothetical protein